MGAREGRPSQGSGSIVAQAQHRAAGEVPIANRNERLSGLVEWEDLGGGGFDSALSVEFEDFRKARGHKHRAPLAVVLTCRPLTSIFLTSR